MEPGSLWLLRTPIFRFGAVVGCGIGMVLVGVVVVVWCGDDGGGV